MPTVMLVHSRPEAWARWLLVQLCFIKDICVVFSFSMWATGTYLERAIHQSHCVVLFFCRAVPSPGCKRLILSPSWALVSHLKPFSSWQIYKTGQFTQISYLLWRFQLHFIFYFWDLGKCQSFVINHHHHHNHHMHYWGFILYHVTGTMLYTLHACVFIFVIASFLSIFNNFMEV